MCYVEICETEALAMSVDGHLAGGYKHPKEQLKVDGGGQVQEECVGKTVKTLEPKLLTRELGKMNTASSCPWGCTRWSHRKRRNLCYIV